MQPFGVKAIQAMFGWLDIIWDMIKEGLPYGVSVQLKLDKIRYPIEFVIKNEE